MNSGNICGGISAGRLLERHRKNSIINNFKITQLVSVGVFTCDQKVRTSVEISGRVQKILLGIIRV